MELKKTYEKIRSIQQKLSHPRCTAIIVAAGSATRMGGTDKMLLKIGPKTVITRTLRAFQENDLIDEIVVVAKEEKLEEIQRKASAFDKVKTVVPGGKTRTESVKHGMEVVTAGTELVAVHDGARPLVTQEVITAAVLKAAKFGAAAPAIPVKDTIKVSTTGEIEATPDRSTLYAVQTPQVFDYDLLWAALCSAEEKGLALTDDCSAVEAIGMKVQLTDGSEENIKITTPLDVAIAEAILNKRAQV